MQDCESKTLPSECDVAIIGGGPTGSSAANRLASQGYHVVLLDKAMHPRNVVGESLIPHFWRYADLLGVSDEIINEGFVAKSGGLALWGDKLQRLRFREFGHDRPALHIERDIFDNILLRRAQKTGAQVFEGVRVLSVDGLEDARSTVNFQDAGGEPGSLKARYVVDASGQAAVVARQLKIREFDEALRFSAFWGYYRKCRYVTYDGEVFGDQDKFKHPPATLVSTIGDWGWSWHIVMRDSVSVGIILPKERLAELRGKTLEEREERFRDLVATVPLTGRLLEPDDYIAGSLLSMRDYAYKPAKLSVGNCFLAGDAAAFVDPINSLGVVFAMFCGTMAAHAISRSLKNPKEVQFNREFYTSQLAVKVALFRLLVLPKGAGDFSPEEVALAKLAIGVASESELELMATQASINSRDDALNKVFREMGISKPPRLESIDWRELAV